MIRLPDLRFRSAAGRIAIPAGQALAAFAAALPIGAVIVLALAVAP